MPRDREKPIYRDALDRTILKFEIQFEEQFLKFCHNKQEISCWKTWRKLGLGKAQTVEPKTVNL